MTEMSELHNHRVAVLASGGGSTAEAFVYAAQDGHVDAEVGLVVCNNPPEKAGVYDRVSELNRRYGLEIQVAQINGRMFPDGNVGRGQTLAESEAIAELIREGGYNHVALMGYMKQVRGALIDEYGWSPETASIYDARMTNTHPGPLPETADTYGIHTSEKVLHLGMLTSRHTVHLVSGGIDQGPVISTREVPVRVGDSAQDLFDRVQITEKRHLPIALNAFMREQDIDNGSTT